MTPEAERTLMVRCPDWPLVAAEVDESVPVVVVAANRVVALSAAARAEGVEEGLRRREAQGRCPELEVVESDPAREARKWEPVVAAVEALALGVEIIGPGTVALGTRGPSRYHGGDAALAEKVATTVNAVLARSPEDHHGARVGVADGRFAAALASRFLPSSAHTLVVPPGGSRSWLAPFSVAALDLPELTGLLTRLGIQTLGELAGLPGPSLLARFGPVGAMAHRLACGFDEQSLAGRTPPPDLAVVAELDPPAERVDMVAFVAKVLADDLHQSLADRGLSCTRVVIEAETEHGEHLVRRWRHDGALTAGAIAERVRWQLDAWLTGRASRQEKSTGGKPDDGSEATTGGLTLLRLTPDEVRPDHGRQLRFWGGSAAGDRRVARTLARVQGMLGAEGVVTGLLGGGRDPGSQVHLIPWGDAPEAGCLPLLEPPWPGRLPGPSPTVLHQPPLAAEVLDGHGQTVEITGRGLISASPATVIISTWGLEVVAWGGPWPVEERWWDSSGRRRARFQVVLADSTAHLVVREGGRWWVEATYD